MEQVDDDDLEEMDIKWQVALLSLKAKKFYQRTGRPITINGNETAGFDKKKVECFNCHKMGHFARECRRPRKARDATWYKQDKKKEPTNEEPKAMLAIDGVSYDWSFMADEEEEPSDDAALMATEIALMAHSDSEVQSFECSSKSCRAARECERLNELFENQRTELFAANYNLSNHKRGMSVLEKQLEHYRENETKFNDDMIILRRELDHKIAVNEALKEELEKLRKKNENVNLSVDTLYYQSKAIDKIWEAQIVNKAKSGLGYNTVPPPLRGVPVPPGIDLAHTGLPEFQEPTLEYGSKSIENTSVEQVKIENDVFESASDSSMVDECVKVNVETSIPEVVKENIEVHRTNEKQPRQSIKYAEMYRKRLPSPRGNQRSWNHLKSRQLGSEFVLNNKACHICGSFDHLHANCNYHEGRRALNEHKRVNKFQNISHPNIHSNMIPRAVQLKSSSKSVSTAQNVNTVPTKKNWTVLLQTGIKNAYPKSPVKSANTTFSTTNRKKVLL